MINVIVKETISYGSKSHPLVDVFNHNKIWYGDFWIPRSLSNELRFVVNKRYDMDEHSIFRLHVGNNPVELFLFNPKTKQFIINYYPNFLSIYNLHVVDERNNLFSDFIGGTIKLHSENQNGIIRFNDYVLSDLKDKKISHMIFETLNLFKNNGAKDNTKIEFGYNKFYDLKYFMQTKFLW